MNDELNQKLNQSEPFEKRARTAVFGYDSFFNMVLALISEGNSESANILVAGCGSGTELKTFGYRMPEWHFTGVDPSAEMIKLSQIAVENKSLKDRIILYHGYVNELPEEKTFDAATLIFVLHFIPDDGSKLDLLKDISKRMRPGAKFIMADQYGNPASPEFRELLSGWENYMQLNGIPSSKTGMMVRQILETHHFVPESRILELLTEAGFDNISQFYRAFLHGGWIATKK